VTPGADGEQILGGVFASLGATLAMVGVLRDSGATLPPGFAPSLGPGVDLFAGFVEVGFVLTAGLHRARSFEWFGPFDWTASLHNSTPSRPALFSRAAY
jgi:hypothetical protein